MEVAMSLHQQMMSTLSIFNMLYISITYDENLHEHISEHHHLNEHLQGAHPSEKIPIIGGAKERLHNRHQCIEYIDK
jgi:hypothetical protein